MFTDFLPTQKIPASQLYAWNSSRVFPLELSLSHHGCTIRDRVSGISFLASTDDEGFIRGAILLSEEKDYLVCALLYEMTGCKWVDEFSEEWPLYRCWTEDERQVHARKVAQDLASDRAEADGISVELAFKLEYQDIYDMHPISIENWQVAA